MLALVSYEMSFLPFDVGEGEFLRDFAYMLFLRMASFGLHEPTRSIGPMTY